MKLLLLLTFSLSAVAAISFEPEPQALANQRSPKLLARRAHGLLKLSTAPSSSGADLIYQSSSDLGDSFTPPQRVNDVPGEVSDHGENSPQLLVSSDEMQLYAVWNARDTKNPGLSHIRFSRAGAMSTAWSPAMTVNDDKSPVQHGFQSAAVGPDGAIYIAWLDGRDGNETESGMTGSTSSIYVAVSRDGGKSFGRNVRIARKICPCCRPSIAFVQGKVVIGWRMVEPGDVRDIFLSSSADHGQTWTEPKAVARDGWRINGCPHVGPAMVGVGGKLHITWFTEGSGDPAIFHATSTDVGATFSVKRRLSGATLDPTHPSLASDGSKLAVVFQARDAKAKQGWGKMAVYYREIGKDGTFSELIRAAEGKANTNYPSVALGLSGRIFISWTETREGVAGAYLLRGRRGTQQHPATD